LESEVIENIVLPEREYRAHAAYGADNHLPHSRLTRHFQWMHGWRPTWFNDFPEEGLGSIWNGNLHGVANAAHMQLITSMGAKACLIGMPFAFELKKNTVHLTKIPNSCLYLPPHMTHEKCVDELTYIDKIKAAVRQYDCVTICLHWASYRNSATRQLYEKFGWNVIEGANNNDSNSLKRMLYLFSQHEVLLVDYFGSHIPYAAACDMNLLFIGENPSRIPLDLSGLCASSVARYRELTNLTTISNHLVAHRSGGGSTLSWGLNEIGFQYVSQMNLMGVIPRNLRCLLSRFGRKMVRRLSGDFGSVKKLHLHDHLVDFIIDKTRFDQTILTFDLLFAERLQKLGKRHTYKKHIVGECCLCSNFVSLDHFEPSDYGTVVSEFCDRCVGQVVRKIRGSNCHTTYILYKYVDSRTLARDLIPPELSATIFDVRSFRLDSELSKPECKYCFSFVVTKP
jgi:hypothetical protein